MNEKPLTNPVQVGDLVRHEDAREWGGVWKLVGPDGLVEPHDAEALATVRRHHLSSPVDLTRSALFRVEPATPSASLRDEVRRAIANGLLAGNDYAAIRRALEAEPPMGQGSPEHFQAGFDLGLVRAAAVCDGIRQANYGRDAAWGVAGACASQIRALRTEQPSPSHANIGAGGGDEWIPACGLADGGGARCGLVKDHPEAHYDTLTGHAWERVGEEKPRPAASPEALSSDAPVPPASDVQPGDWVRIVKTAWQGQKGQVASVVTKQCDFYGLEGNRAIYCVVMREPGCDSRGINFVRQEIEPLKEAAQPPANGLLARISPQSVDSPPIRLDEYGNPLTHADAYRAGVEAGRQMADGKADDSHPWGAFLHARARVLRWLRDEMKETPEKTCVTMAMDPVQVRSILMHVDESPKEYPPEPATPQGKDGA